MPVFFPIAVDGLAAAECSDVVFQRGVAQTSRSGPFPLACYLQRHLQWTDNCNFLHSDGDHVKQILSVKCQLTYHCDEQASRTRAGSGESIPKNRTNGCSFAVCPHVLLIPSAGYMLLVCFILTSGPLAWPKLRPCCACFSPATFSCARPFGTRAPPLQGEHCLVSAALPEVQGHRQPQAPSAERTKHDGGSSRACRNAVGPTLV